MEAYEHRYELLEVAPEISHVHRPLVSAICYIGNLYFRLDSELTIFKSILSLYAGGIEYIEIIENKNVKRARRYTDTRIASAYIYKCQGIDPTTSITNVLEEFRVVLNSPRMTVTKYIGKTAQRIIYLNVRSNANVERITDALIDAGIRRCCVELVKKRSGQAAYCTVTVNNVSDFITATAIESYNSSVLGIARSKYHVIIPQKPKKKRTRSCNCNQSIILNYSHSNASMLNLGNDSNCKCYKTIVLNARHSNVNVMNVHSAYIKKIVINASHSNINMLNMIGGGNPKIVINAKHSNVNRMK
jgi:hypothetical protein